ncbi:MAG: T9SS type A sorting domain-containing protein [Bacteroidales bacterium]|nr:T9SS type A sorting domain-containing protein [Bacteroidales bacterium]
MKTHIFLFATIFFISPMVEGQDYIPFPTQNASWNIYLESTCENDSPTDTFLLRYSILGDTTINEKTYHKLVLEKGDTINPTLEPIGGIREEGKKVYFYGQGFLRNDPGEELLLYDFNVQIGDTIKHSSDGPWKSIVLDIDSIQIGDHYRKRYKVDNGWIYHNPDYIIEGIGSVLNGLLGHISDIPTCGTHYWEHVCFRENEQILYLNPNYLDCNAGINTNSIIDKNKIWYNLIYIYHGWNIDTEVISIGEDTTINDTNYSQVLRATGGNEIPIKEYGFIRSDNDKVYYRTNSENPERLIYDFSISVGDTTTVYGLIDWSTDHFIECQYICDSILFREFYETQRTVYYLSINLLPDHNCESWIEGIGSLSGILHNYTGLVGGDAFYLSCVKDNDGFLFRKNESEACVKLSVSDNNKIANKPMIYPNPFSEFLHINSLEGIGKSTFRLYGSDGKIQLQTEISEKAIIDVSALSTGLYYYSIINDNQFGESGKLIKY